MNWFRNLEQLKKHSLVIVISCITGLLLHIIVKPFRGTWIYQYGSILGLFLFYGGLLWSFVNIVFVILKYRKSVKKNVLWILLNALPGLYILFNIIT